MNENNHENKDVEVLPFHPKMDTKEVRSFLKDADDIPVNSILIDKDPHTGEPIKCLIQIPEEQQPDGIYSIRFYFRYFLVYDRMKSDRPNVSDRLFAMGGQEFEDTYRIKDQITYNIYNI